MRPGGNTPPNFHQVEVPAGVKHDQQLQGYSSEGRFQVRLEDLINLIAGGGVDLSTITFITLNDETASLPASIPLQVTESIICKASDETTPLTTGTNKVRFRVPYLFHLTAVKASLNVAQSSGSIFTIDINESGITILSTKLTIDNTETTSVTAVTPAVISDATLASDAEIGIDIDQVGAGDAAGLTITLIGHQ